MSFTVSKLNGQLIFNDFGCYETRNPSTIWCIIEADKHYNFPDFETITISTSDNEYETRHIDNIYTYSKCDSFKNLIPDFNFHKWSEAGIRDYAEMIKKIDEFGRVPYIINKVGWIGTLSHEVRKNFIEIANNNSNLFDCISMKWFDDKIEDGHIAATKYISLDELVKTYSILIDIEGNGYSGRLKYLLWSHRPVLLVDRPHKEFFFEYLKEWEHYIPVKRDLSDLIEKTIWCMTNPDEANKIAENAYKFSQTFLTREACFKQWRKVINWKHTNSFNNYFKHING
jgi:hypothetical protein